MGRFFYIVFFLLTFSQIHSQEFNCSINLNTDAVPGSNRQVFNTLEQSLNEFVNQKKWTNYEYQLHERLITNFTINILEANNNSFKGSIQAQSSRPVFNASYQTPVLNFMDQNFSFQYEEYEPLQYNETVYESNLSSIISFYIYIMLGLDADTFSEMGGTPFFEQAKEITILAQQSGYSGWNQNDGINTRFTLIDNLLSPRYSDLRKILYKYHRLGIDNYSTDPKKSKATIAATILDLNKIYNDRPNAFLIRVFMDAKADEIFNIFSSGPVYSDKKKLISILKTISPINDSKWDKL
jgi:hypothetical protein